MNKYELEKVSMDILMIDANSGESFVVNNIDTFLLDKGEINITNVLN